MFLLQRTLVQNYPCVSGFVTSSKNSWASATHTQLARRSPHCYQPLWEKTPGLCKELHVKGNLLLSLPDLQMV